MDDATQLLRRLDAVLAKGALSTLTIGRRTPQSGEQPFFVHAHIYEVRLPLGVCAEGRHFMCQGATLEEVLDRTLTEVDG